MTQSNAKVNEVWEDLIISILSVYMSTLEKTYKFKDNFVQEGLFNLDNLAKWDSQDIGNKLKNAGYDKGGVTWIFSERLSYLGKNIKDKEKIEKILLSNNKVEIRNTLLPIKGIGEKVIENFYILREIY